MNTILQTLESTLNDFMGRIKNPKGILSIFDALKEANKEIIILRGIIAYFATEHVFHGKWEATDEDVENLIQKMCDNSGVKRK